MILHHSTWPQVEKYLSDKRGIIIPIGSTEQHGPTGLIGTDAIIAEKLSHAVGERLGVYVAPTLSIGMAHHHLGFPGSMTLRPQTMINVLVDWFSSLQKHGFRDIFIINGHGGNIPATETAICEFHAMSSLERSPRNDDMKVLLKNWWAGQKLSPFSEELYGDRRGVHATADELAVIRYLIPEAADIPAPEGWTWPGPDFARFSDCNNYRDLYPDGAIASDITLANAEDGKKLFNIAVDDLSKDCEEFMA